MVPPALRLRPPERLLSASDRPNGQPGKADSGCQQAASRENGAQAEHLGQCAGRDHGQGKNAVDQGEPN